MLRYPNYGTILESPDNLKDITAGDAKVRAADENLRDALPRLMKGTQVLEAERRAAAFVARPATNFLTDEVPAQGQ